MTTERELKLELFPAAEAACLGDLLGLGAPAVKKLNATYFDTPDFALAKQHCSLRIRKEGRRRIQTVKTDAAPASGLLTRTEWEQPARGPMPSLDIDNPVSKLLGPRVADLSPRFEVAVVRRIWQVDTGTAAIEMALDMGEARAGDSGGSFCEIELELRSGDMEELFLLGRRIGGLVPARLGVLTKSQRARRLLRGPGKADKATAIPLTPEMTAGDAFRRIVHACLVHYRLNEARLLVADDAEAVHQARVAIRRLRSAFVAFRDIAHGKRMRRFNHELRWLGGQLGTARDIDVLLDRIADKAVRARLSAARADAYAMMRRAIASDLARGLMLDIAEWLSIGKWTHAKGRAKHRDASVTAHAARALGRLHKRLIEEGEAIDGPDDERRHEARKTAKKLRYTAEFFARLYQGKQRKARVRYLAGLEELQDHLGALNDMAIMPEMLHRLHIASDLAGVLAGQPDLHRLQASDAMAAIRTSERFWA
ncbi:inorganic triphosphatase [soil metagenome]